VNLICLACFIFILMSGLWCFEAQHVCEDVNGLVRACYVQHVFA